MKPSGWVLWRGPSLLGGAPIAVIATTKSENAKTGNMVQTYILRSDVTPLSALKSGADSAICGNCKLRPANGGGCYVNVFQAPQGVYRKLERGGYPLTADIPAVARGRLVRLGSYGDPAAVPAHVWKQLVSQAAGHTGYTHQWNNPELPAEQMVALRSLCMASVDSEAERLSAAKQGWRTFRVRSPGEPVQLGEFVCPASDEADNARSCSACKACDGASPGTRKASPVIIVHGPRAVKFMQRPLAVSTHEELLCSSSA